MNLQYGGCRTAPRSLYSSNRKRIYAGLTRLEGPIRASHRIDSLQGWGGESVLQVVCIGEPALSERRNGCSFPGTQELGQAPRVGVSRACGLFELWLRGICRFCNRIAQASGNRFDLCLTCHRDWAQAHHATAASTV
jgi:hypothetical protein